MKKILLNLASIALISSSSLSAIACVSSSDINNSPINSTMELSNSTVNITPGINNLSNDQLKNYSHFTGVTIQSMNTDIVKNVKIQSSGLITIYSGTKAGTTTIQIQGTNRAKVLITGVITVNSKFNAELSTNSVSMNTNATDSKSLKITNFASIGNDIKFNYSGTLGAIATYDSSTGQITITSGSASGSEQVTISGEKIKDTTFKLTINKSNINLNKNYTFSSPLLLVSGQEFKSSENKEQGVQVTNYKDLVNVKATPENTSLIKSASIDENGYLNVTVGVSNSTKPIIEEITISADGANSTNVYVSISPNIKLPLSTNEIDFSNYKQTTNVIVSDPNFKLLSYKLSDTLGSSNYIVNYDSSSKTFSITAPSSG